MTLWSQVEQSQRVIWQLDASQFSRATSSSLATGEAMRIMQEAEQFEATLVAAFTPRQDGPQQAIDAFGQHAAAPGAVQNLAQSLPGLSELLPIQKREGLIQGLALNERHGAAFGVGFGLLQAGQGLNSWLSPALDQRVQSLLQDRVVGKQSIDPLDQIAAQFVVDAALPAPKLFPERTQGGSCGERVTQPSALQINQGKLGIHLLGQLVELARAGDFFLRFGSQVFPDLQMLFQPPGVWACWN